MNTYDFSKNVNTFLIYKKEVVKMGYDGGGYGGGSSSFVLIVVLFILLIIVGTSFWS
ncbi:YjcZ family sporulation protein [Niallia oryzisoli]